MPNDSNLPVYNPVMPDLSRNPNVKLAVSEIDAMFGNMLENKQLTFDDVFAVSDPAAEQPITVKCRVYFISTMDAENILSLSQPFTEYDRAVQGAVASLWAVGNTIVTASTVYKVMTGVDPVTSSHVTESQLKAVEASLWKLYVIQAEVDFTEHAHACGKGGDQWVVDGSLVPQQKIRVLVNGESCRAYRLLAPPLLYEYADKVNQVLAIPVELLRIGGSDTAWRIGVRMYLLRRILTKNPQTTILYQSIYDAAALEKQPSRNKKMDIRTFVINCLNELQHRGYITSWTPHLDSAGTYISISFVRGNNLLPSV